VIALTLYAIFVVALVVDGGFLMAAVVARSEASPNDRGLF